MEFGSVSQRRRARIDELAEALPVRAASCGLSVAQSAFAPMPRDVSRSSIGAEITAPAAAQPEEEEI